MTYTSDRCNHRKAYVYLGAWHHIAHQTVFLLNVEMQDEERNSRQALVATLVLGQPLTAMGLFSGRSGDRNAAVA